MIHWMPVNTIDQDAVDQCATCGAYGEFDKAICPDCEESYDTCPECGCPTPKGSGEPCGECREYLRLIEAGHP